jgi:hypothetical protein
MTPGQLTTFCVYHKRVPNISRLIEYGVTKNIQAERRRVENKAEHLRIGGAMVNALRDTLL